MATVSLSGRPTPFWLNWVDTFGRGIVYGIAFLIPLAFFKETHYIFQIKTTLLQLGGWLLSLAILSHFFLTQKKDIFKDLPLWVILPLAWATWMSFKSWDSISPTLSWREASRQVWLPLVCLSTILFFREEQQKRKLLNTVILSACLVTVFAALIRFNTTREFLLSAGPSKLDIFDFPILLWILKSFFFPPELLNIFTEEIQKASESSNQILSLGGQSFYPGKPDAGTFGNKNFLAGYLNLTLPLLIWKSHQLFHRSKDSSRPPNFLQLTLLISVALLQLFLIVSIGNRASWLGLLVALMAAPLLLLLRQKSWRVAIRWALLPLMLVSVLLIAQPQRTSSILNPFQNSIELRLLTWSSWLEGFSEDDSWSGFSSKGWRWCTGWGNHSFQVAYPKYRNDRIFKIENNQHGSVTKHAHSHPLNTLGELGLIGLTLELLLFLSPLFLLFRCLVREKEKQLLPCVLGLALLTQYIQSLFSVAPRYTGVAFQTWITLSLLIISLPATSVGIKTRRAPKWIIPSLAALCLCVMPNPLWPINWLQSQLFHAQAQSLQTQAKKHHRDARSIEKELAKSESISPKKNGAMMRALSHHRKELLTLAPMADLYYDLALKKDPAQLESPYFAAIMQVQFGQQHLAYQQIGPANELFEEAIERLNYIRAHAPHFVQIDYWSALALKGRAMARKTVGNSSGAQKDLEQALNHLRDYAKLDPHFPEVAIESFYCYHRLGRQQEANLELKKVLFGALNYGSNLSRKDPRFDAIRVSQFLHDRQHDDEKIELEMVLNLVHHFQSSTCLLPHLPKTQRHVKNSFHIVQDPHGH